MSRGGNTCFFVVHKRIVVVLSVKTSQNLRYSAKFVIIFEPEPGK